MQARPPPSYWATMIALAGLVMSALALISQTGKADKDDVRQNEHRVTALESTRADKGEVNRLEQRLCRLEGIADTGECKR